MLSRIYHFVSKGFFRCTPHEGHFPWMCHWKLRIILFRAQFLTSAANKTRTPFAGMHASPKAVRGTCSFILHLASGFPAQQTDDFVRYHYALDACDWYSCRTHLACHIVVDTHTHNLCKSQHTHHMPGPLPSIVSCVHACALGHGSRAKESPSFQIDGLNTESSVTHPAWNEVEFTMPLCSSPGGASIPTPTHPNESGILDGLGGHKFGCGWF